MNYIVPTTVIDDFFEDPMSVRNYALKQSYRRDILSRWPGRRTEMLHIINPKLFTHTMDRFLSIFYPDRAFEYSAISHFQLTDSSFGSGWVHRDPDLITLLIYLNPDSPSNCGTTLYESKETGSGLLHTDKKRQYFNGELESDEIYRKENNEQFKESVIIKNRFNRLIAFDSNILHAANDFCGDKQNNDERLTLVTFITKLNVQRYPLQTMKTYFA